MTKRETVLKALFAGLQSLEATVLRGGVLPERVPSGGLLILRDGDPGTPEVTLSPLTYHYEHRAEIEVVVQDGGDRNGAFDALIEALGLALNSDRTLGGLCHWVEAEAPEPLDLPVDGGVAFKAAAITVVLNYTASDPLI